MLPGSVRSEEYASNTIADSLTATGNPAAAATVSEAPALVVVELLKDPSEETVVLPAAVSDVYAEKVEAATVIVVDAAAPSLMVAVTLLPLTSTVSLAAALSEILRA